MRDKTHTEQIERWANFIKNNPTKWKPELKQFLDAQIIRSNNFLKRLEKQPNGKEKILLLRSIQTNTP